MIQAKDLSTSVTVLTVRRHSPCGELSQSQSQTQPQSSENPEFSLFMTVHQTFSHFPQILGILGIGLNATVYAPLRKLYTCIMVFLKLSSIPCSRSSAKRQNLVHNGFIVKYNESQK